jgi:hypothetical protein
MSITPSRRAPKRPASSNDGFLLSTRALLILLIGVGCGVIGYFRPVVGAAIGSAAAIMLLLNTIVSRGE